MTTPTILLRDTNMAIIGEIDDFSEVAAVGNYNDVGSYYITLPANYPLLSQLTFRSGIVIQRNGLTVSSGPITGLSYSYSPTENTVTINGPDDNVWLQRQLADPCTQAGSLGTIFSAAANDTITDNAENAMIHYVTNNLGSGAASFRRTPSLVIQASTSQGSSVVGSARFQTVLNILQNLAYQSSPEVGFRIVQNSTSTIQFQVFTPADKTATAQFSVELGNLSEYSLSNSAPTANAVIVGGSGGGTARNFVDAISASGISQYGRIELFDDRRDAPDNATLVAQATSTLATSGAQVAINALLLDSAKLRFQTDYGLGDKVTIFAAGYTIQQPIRQVNYSWTFDEGEVIRPVIGTPGASDPMTPMLFDQLAALDDRISHLEATQ